MGFAVLAHAMAIKVGSSSVKWTLVALAENADNETGEAYPSIASIVRKSELDRKTVIAALDRLLVMGLIRDTGRRAGPTGRVKVYRFVGAPFVIVPKTALLNGPKFPHVMVPNFPSNGPENGTQNQSGTSQGISHPPTAPQGGQASECDLIADAEEAKRLICERILKGKNPARPWSKEATEALARQLPIPRKEIELIGWFHGLADDPEAHELKVRRRSETTLLANWSDEFTRAANFRKKTGPDPEVHFAKKKRWPGRSREWLNWKYPHLTFNPTSFDVLPADVRDEWASEHEEWEKANPVTAAKEMIRKEAA